MYDLLCNGFRDRSAAVGAPLFEQGHGSYWGPAADYLAANLTTWRRALNPSTT